jgi:hypothetical protein
LRVPVDDVPSDAQSMRVQMPPSQRRAGIDRDRVTLRASPTVSAPASISDFRAHHVEARATNQKLSAGHSPSI